MTADKRTVTTDALETLGTIISENEKRDAIHLAVEPVFAATRLLPGDHVALDPTGRAVQVQIDEGVGIVDPFLANPVLAGERFWLVVYPRQITSLRHVWEHPDFPPSELRAPEAVSAKAASEAWLRKFIAGADCPSYEEVIAAAIHESDEGNGIRESYDGNEHYLFFRGSDAHGDIPDEFWDHVELVTGRKGLIRAQYFSCSC